MNKPTSVLLSLFLAISITTSTLGQTVYVPEPKGATAIGGSYFTNGDFGAQSVIFGVAAFEGRGDINLVLSDNTGDFDGKSFGIGLATWPLIFRGKNSSIYIGPNFSYLRSTVKTIGYSASSDLWAVGLSLASRLEGEQSVSLLLEADVTYSEDFKNSDINATVYRFAISPIVQVSPHSRLSFGPQIIFTEEEKFYGGTVVLSFEAKAPKNSREKFE